MPINSHELPHWCVEAKKALIERNMTVRDLAIELDCSREHVSSVLNARVRNLAMKERICDHLDIRILSVR